MTSLTLAIVIVFITGYLCIALESVTKVNKAAVALLMFVFCWTFFMLDPGAYLTGVSSEGLVNVVSEAIEHHLGSTSTTLFFLMGAMTIVEIVDQNGGFNFVRDTLKTKSKRALLWRIAIMTFCHPRQSDYEHRYGDDTAQIGTRPQRPTRLRLADHYFRQFGWRFLPHRRRNNHYALE